MTTLVCQVILNLFKTIGRPVFSASWIMLRSCVCVVLMISAVGYSPINAMLIRNAAISPEYRKDPELLKKFRHMFVPVIQYAF